jgi:hypothetical protein
MLSVGMSETAIRFTEFDKIWHQRYAGQGHPDLVPFNFPELAKTKGRGERDIS